MTVKPLLLAVSFRTKASEFMHLSYTRLAAAVLLVAACQRPTVDPARQGTLAAVASTLTETFESGTKTAYATANVTLTSGVWTLNDALIGNSSSDLKAGTQSARVRNSGRLTMKFDKAGGAGTVSVSHGNYGSDAGGSWQLWYSTDAGATYTQAPGTIACASALTTSTITLNLSGSIRIDIRKVDGGTGRINVDNITITDYSGTNPVPSLSSISPTSATAGAAATTLTVNGSNFVSASVVNWNGSALTTTYVSATKLTAAVPASLLTTAGSASVSVVSPAPGGGTSSGATFTINAVVTGGGKRVLFDAAHGQTAGNADWVIDEDGSTPIRIPTPAQSGITSSTAETYWTGAISSWGIALVKKGYTVETLPSGTSITYGGSGAQDLSKYDVFVVDEPNIRFTTAEKIALLQFVQNGGGLVMISDHAISDRNNDGWDSQEIWNDFFTNNTLVSNPFGISVDANNLVGVTSNRLSSTTNPVLNGAAGAVSQLSFNNGASLTLNTTANPNVQGLIWKSGSTQNNTNVWACTSTYGTGRVFMIGDSSPMDDGTGAPGNTLYVGWSTYSHSQLMLNASYWVAKQ